MKRKSAGLRHNCDPFGKATGHFHVHPQARWGVTTAARCRISSATAQQVHKILLKRDHLPVIVLSQDPLPDSHRQPVPAICEKSVACTLPALDAGMFNIKAAAGVDFDARDAQHAAAGLVGFCFTSRIKGFPWRPRNDLVPAAVVRQAILEWWGGHHLHGCARNNACPASGRTC